EVKKPGLKAFLQQMDRELGAKSNKPLRVVNVQELALLKPTPKGTNDPIVLVRPDLVIVGSDVATVRRLNRPTPTAVKLTATPFGQRVAQAYQSGAGILFAVDLATILKQNPATSPKDQQMLQQTGIADMKYLVWEHKDVAGQPSSQTELSFNGPRHGVVSWLGSPIALGSMNFFSPKAAVALAIALKRPSQIYDEASEMMTASGSGAFGMVGTMESQFNIDLKRDLLDKLTGEIGIEASGLGDPEPSWKAVLGVKDADGLQQTLAKVLAAIPMEVKTHDEDGITYNRLHIPNPNKPVDIHYAFVNGYLVITPSRTLMQEAVQFERSGESLGQSSRFRSALPQGYPPEASALLYENIGAMMAPILRQASPDLAKVLPLMNADAPPVVMGLYGDESSIRQANNSGSFDVSGVMIVAAIAVPNLLRARNAADESAAASTMRTINTAQVTYATTYPQRGYAPDLATLGPGGGECGNSVSDEHACLLNAELGGAACTSGSWCVKGNYRYSVAASCKEKLCEEYVAVASPAAMDGSGKSFCTTSEMVIRSRPGARLETPISVEECQSWPPIQ
ncbi:MAG TPA: DUF3352 domain-containing protein, partial [Alphaproteobacteria bacterium]|nr:DUF3352 domain-containing protein [Alphaproteobacteria bacterium]